MGEKNMKTALFYDRFIELCNAKGVKPTPVLKQIGLSAGCLTKWQSGSVIRANTLEKIAAYFGVNVDYFFSDDAECRKFEVILERRTDNDGNNKGNNNLPYQSDIGHI